MRVFDLHCDTIDRLGMTRHPAYAPEAPADAPVGESLVSNHAALAAERMMGAGGAEAWCQCYAVWVPDRCDPAGGVAFYRQARDWFASQMRAHPDRIEQVRDGRLADEPGARGRVGALLAIENGLALGTDLAMVDEVARDGVKMVTLTWNAPNPIGSGKLSHQGLTAFGRDVVRALEDRRIVVDVSHLNDEGFWELTKLVRRPFVASHSNARAVCGVPRNLTDDQFRAIRDAGGLVGINYYRGFVSPRYIGVPDGRLAPDGDATFDELAAHIEHFLDLDGAATLALGSDFDGSDVPTWLDACEKVPALYRAVCDRFGVELADRMFYGNARAFFARNEG